MTAMTAMASDLGFWQFYATALPAAIGPPAAAIGPKSAVYLRIRRGCSIVDVCWRPTLEPRQPPAATSRKGPPQCVLEALQRPGPGISASDDP